MTSQSPPIRVNSFGFHTDRQTHKKTHNTFIQICCKRMTAVVEGIPTQQPHRALCAHVCVFVLSVNQCHYNYMSYTCLTFPAHNHTCVFRTEITTLCSLNVVCSHIFTITIFTLRTILLIQSLATRGCARASFPIFF